MWEVEGWLSGGVQKRRREKGERNGDPYGLSRERGRERKKRGKSYGLLTFASMIENGEKVRERERERKGMCSMVDKGDRR